MFPIPPGVHWSEVRAVEVPRKELSVVSGQLSVVKKEKTIRRNNGRRTTDHGRDGYVGILVGGRIKYVAKPESVGPVEQKPAANLPSAKTPKVKAPAAKACPERRRRIDPKYLAAARELRDRYLERVNASVEALPAPSAKYEVSRRLDGPKDGGTRALSGLVAKALPSAA